MRRTSDQFGRVYVVFNNKGGVGKSFLSKHLAVRLKEYYPDQDVVLVDLNADQGETLQFPDRRAKKVPEKPHLISVAPANVAELRAVLAALRARGARVVVDCPPAQSLMADEALKLADAVVFPFRTGAHDQEALGRATAIAKKAKNPNGAPHILGVLNFFDPALRESEALLRAFQHPDRRGVFTIMGAIRYRPSPINSALASQLAVWEYIPTVKKERQAAEKAAIEVLGVCDNILSTVEGK